MPHSRRSHYPAATAATEDGLELLGCPECDAPAEVVAGHRLPCTDGPVEHVRIWCAAGHVFLMPRDMLMSRGGRRRT